MASARLTGLALALSWMGMMPAFAQPATAPPAAPPAAKPALPDVDLKLFDKAEIDRSKGCSLALWQANRDPEKDRYAFAFFETFAGPNHARQPAKMKIGANVVTLTRVATGGKTTGYGIYERQLYKLPGENDFVILDLKPEPEMGEAVDIDAGKLTVVMDGRQPFRMAVKGGAGCMTPAAPAPPAAKRSEAPLPSPASPSSTQQKAAAATSPSAPAAAPAKPAARVPGPAMFSRYTPRPQQIPKGLLLLAERSHACDPQVMKSGIVGFQMSEESAIWEIPCERFAYQAASIFALVYLPSPLDNLTFVSLSNPPGKMRTSAPSQLMNPVWDMKSRTVTGVALGRSIGDCGVLERHRVTEAGEFELVEYREKEKCDGKSVSPESFPLVFKAR